AQPFPRRTKRGAEPSHFADCRDDRTVSVARTAVHVNRARHGGRYRCQGCWGGARSLRAQSSTRPASLTGSSYSPAMRYIDSGIRDAPEALGTWLGAELLGPGTVKALRVQTGFFSADAMGYFENALLELKHHDGHTRILIGSNDGVTPRSDLAAMLAVVGAPRSNSRIGVVSYQRGYFHPKVFHVERTDGTHTAYVGSSNLTGAGVTSLHVEAGLILDTAKSD